MRGLAAISALGSTGPTEVINDDDSVFGSGTVLVDFNAKWCGPCRRQGPNVDALADQFPGQVFKVDTDANSRIADKYGAHSIPTLIVFKDGHEIIRHQGIHSTDEMAQWMGGSPDGSSWASSGAPAAPVQSATTYADASAFGSPPDSSGWAPVYLDGVPKWHKGQQFVDINSPSTAPAAAPALLAPAVAVPAASPEAAAPAAPVGVQNVTVNVSANPTDWSYVLQHKNSKWEAVLLDGKQVFWNRKGGSQAKFVSSIAGMSGMRGLGIMGSLGVMTLPVKSFTTSGSGLSLGNAGLILGGVAATGVVGYLLYRMLK